jgi:hypothetical protein
MSVLGRIFTARKNIKYSKKYYFDGLKSHGSLPACYQYRSFWSWRGGEATEDDTSITKSSSNKSKSKSKKKSSTKHGRYEVSVGTEQGFRSYMEDEHFVSTDGDFCCCFDGHGGKSVSFKKKR